MIMEIIEMSKDQGDNGNIFSPWSLISPIPPYQEAEQF